jgi:PhoPQ-activated pathogenicity-related protein
VCWAAEQADIVDAYAYFKSDAPWSSPSFNTMPKLVVNAGNDEFFLPDDDHSWRVCIYV